MVLCTGRLCLPSALHLAVSFTSLALALVLAAFIFPQWEATEKFFFFFNLFLHWVLEKKGKIPFKVLGLCLPKYVLCSPCKGSLSLEIPWDSPPKMCYVLTLYGQSFLGDSAGLVFQNISGVNPVRAFFLRRFRRTCLPEHVRCKPCKGSLSSEIPWDLSPKMCHVLINHVRAVFLQRFHRTCLLEPVRC